MAGSEGGGEEQGKLGSKREEEEEERRERGGSRFRRASATFCPISFFFYSILPQNFNLLY